MSRRLFRLLAAAGVLSAGGCAVLGDALDQSLGRAFGETDAEYRQRRADRDRMESLERGGLSQRDAAELAAQMRATDAALAAGSGVQPGR